MNRNLPDPCLRRDDIHGDSKKRQTLELLQVLRGVAAMLIVIKHALYEIGGMTAFVYRPEIYDQLVVGVDIFFFISGFIMVYTTFGQTGGAAAKSFMLRRVARIVPLYWVYTFALLGVALIMPQVLGSAQFAPLDFIKSLLFIPYLNSSGDIQPFLAVGWTLNYEMYFYAVFALCLLLPARFSLPILSGYFISTVACGFLGFENVFVQFYTNPIVLEFLGGALIGYAFVKDWRLPSYMLPLGVFLTCTSFVLLLMPDVPIITRSLVALMAIAFLTLPRGTVRMHLPRFSMLIGDASYSIYLSHPFAIGAVTQIISLLNLDQSLPFWLIFAVVFITSILGGIIAYLVIEWPLLKRTKKFLYREN